MKQSDLKDLSTTVKNIYDWGCYFLDILYLAFNREPTFNEMIEYYNLFTSKGYMDKDCYMRNPAAALSELTGRKVIVVFNNEYDSKAAFNIGYYYNPRTNYHHFVVMQSKDKVEWDSIQNSVTVREGFVESYRNFYFV